MMPPVPQIARPVWGHRAVGKSGLVGVYARDMGNPTLRTAAREHARGTRSYSSCVEVSEGAAHARHAVQLARSNARCERYTSPAGDGLLLHMSTSEG